MCASEKYRIPNADTQETEADYSFCRDTSRALIERIIAGKRFLPADDYQPNDTEIELVTQVRDKGFGFYNVLINRDRENNLFIDELTWDHQVSYISHRWSKTQCEKIVITYLFDNDKGVAHKCIFNSDGVLTEPIETPTLGDLKDLNSRLNECLENSMRTWKLFAKAVALPNVC